MAVTALTIMDKASKILNDTGVTRRWSQADLFEAVNEGQKFLCFHKPEINTINETTVLVEGTKQVIPTGGTGLFDIPRNMGTDGATPGSVPRYVDKDVFTSRNPDWQTATASSDVERWMYDPKDPLVYWVYPPQPSSNFGYVQLVYPATPTDIVANPGPDYDVAINIPDIYEILLVDYLLYVAYARNAANSQYAGQRALAYYNAIATALGLKLRVELSESPG